MLSIRWGVPVVFVRKDLAWMPDLLPPPENTVSPAARNRVSRGAVPKRELGHEGEALKNNSPHKFPLPAYSNCHRPAAGAVQPAALAPAVRRAFFGHMSNSTARCTSTVTKRCFAVICRNDFAGGAFLHYPWAA
jgi:hypothetical protein